MIEKMNSKWLPLATASILGQAPGTGSRILYLFAALILGSALAAPAIAGDRNVRYFDRPPSAEALADVLFPMQYRSISGEQETPAGPKFSAFGMPIQFEFGSTTIVATSLPFLDSVGEMLNLDSLADSRLIIEGHTDAAGGSEYNQTLSEARADAVRLYLVSVFNIDPGRLVILGRGETELFDSRDPRAASNRRVEFRAMTTP